MQLDNNTQAFIALVEAGLWEKDVRLSQYGSLDYRTIFRLAEVQSVVGLVTAGLEHIDDIKPPKEVALAFASNTLLLEQRNRDMNVFIGDIVTKLRSADIYTLLVKGQGIAQCYVKPLWRACGDVDLLLSDDNYRKAKSFLSQIASFIEDENPYNKHIEMTINNWSVELHGTMRSGLWRRLERGIDEAQQCVFYGGNVRSWMNGKAQIFLPRADEDVVFVFTHILQHFFSEGVGLRQICDWCRLLWTYRDLLNRGLLESRIRKMGLMSEWKTFGALAVNTLGVSAGVMPFYSDSKKWNEKAKRVLKLVLETGNFGQNRDHSYYKKYPYVVFKLISFWRHTKDALRYSFIFPWDSILVWGRMIVTGISLAVKKK